MEEFRPNLLDQVIPFRELGPNGLICEHRLRLVSRLGGGTYGEVYKAIPENVKDDGTIDQKDLYAVKYYTEETRSVMEAGLGSTTVRELSAVAGCGTHPNVVSMKFLFADTLPKLAKSINSQCVEWAMQLMAEATPEQRDQLNESVKMNEMRSSQIFIFAAYEYCEGGDLKRLLNENRNGCNPEGTICPSWGLSLKVTKHLIFQLLNGIAFIHNQKLCHRDLKPDNLMLTTTDMEKCILKIGDLGLCREIRSRTVDITPTVCTIYYRPLEVLLRGMKVESSDGGVEVGVHYGLGVDIWGAACIMAEMLRGVALFKGTQEFDILIRITKILGTPTEEEWKCCSALQLYPFHNRNESHYFSEHDKRQNLNAVLGGKLDLDGLDLLSRMLDYNPHTRISAAEALSHQWFTDICFGQLDGLGVYNWYIDVLKFRLGELTFEAMERHTPKCLTGTKIAHILAQKGYRGAAIQRINRVFNEIGGFKDPSKISYWKAVVAAERMAARHQRPNKNSSNESSDSAIQPGADENASYNLKSSDNGKSSNYFDYEGGLSLQDSISSLLFNPWPQLDLDTASNKSFSGPI